MTYKEKDLKLNHAIDLLEDLDIDVNIKYQKILKMIREKVDQPAPRKKTASSSLEAKQKVRVSEETIVSNDSQAPITTTEPVITENNPVITKSDPVGVETNVASSETEATIKPVNCDKAPETTIAVNLPEKDNQPQLATKKQAEPNITKKVSEKFKLALKVADEFDKNGGLFGWLLPRENLTPEFVEQLSIHQIKDEVALTEIIRGERDIYGFRCDSKTKYSPVGGEIEALRISDYARSKGTVSFYKMRGEGQKCHYTKDEKDPDYLHWRYRENVLFEVGFRPLPDQIADYLLNHKNDSNGVSKSDSEETPLASENKNDDLATRLQKIDEELGLVSNYDDDLDSTKDAYDVAKEIVNKIQIVDESEINNDEKPKYDKWFIDQDGFVHDSDGSVVTDTTWISDLKDRDLQNKIYDDAQFRNQIMIHWRANGDKYLAKQKDKNIDKLE